MTRNWYWYKLLRTSLKPYSVIQHSRINVSPGAAHSGVRCPRRLGTGAAACCRAGADIAAEGLGPDGHPGAVIIIILLLLLLLSGHPGAVILSLLL